MTYLNMNLKCQIWLPEKKIDTFLYKPSKDVYIPSRALDNDNDCYCGLVKADPTDANCIFLWR